MTVKTVALLTAGGLAPCLSSAVGGLIEKYTEVAPDVRIIGYLGGYAGLLTGQYVELAPEQRAQAHLLHLRGGSPIGNSRVKLTNVADCVKRGLVQEGLDPLHVAAEQLTKDGVDVLHTIGGDDTNTTAADLAAYLHENDYELTVVGLPMPRPRGAITRGWASRSSSLASAMTRAAGMCTLSMSRRCTSTSMPRPRGCGR